MKSHALSGSRFAFALVAVLCAVNAGLPAEPFLAQVPATPR
jgi:hypothetical protein